MSESRLAPAWAALRAQERTALIPYLTAGYPSAEASLAALRMADEVADIIEVGVPFSDPLADGPTIQRSTFDALRQGMTLAGTLALIERARLARPIVVFSYLNPILRYGLDRFLRDADALGVAGVLLTDLPAGSDAGVESAIRTSPLDLIRLIAPTTPSRAARGLGRGRAGFRVSRRPPRGDGRDRLPRGWAGGVDRPGPAGDAAAGGRRIRDLHAGTGTTVAGQADGVVVGSALVDILGTRGVAAAGEFLRALREALDARTVAR